MQAYLKCRVCGTVHRAVTRQAAEEDVTRFNTFWASLTQAERRRWYGGRCLGIETYLRCSHCRARNTGAVPVHEAPASCMLPMMVAGS